MSLLKNKLYARIRALLTYTRFIQDLYKPYTSLI
jgi:hypothetical protein